MYTTASLREWYYQCRFSGLGYLLYCARTISKLSFQYGKCLWEHHRSRYSPSLGRLFWLLHPANSFCISNLMRVSLHALPDNPCKPLFQHRNISLKVVPSFIIHLLCKDILLANIILQFGNTNIFLHKYVVHIFLRSLTSTRLEVYIASSLLYSPEVLCARNFRLWFGKPCVL